VSLHTVIAKSEKFLGDNSPAILTAVGAAGVLTTAFLTGKATIKACELREYDFPNLEQRQSRPKQETIKRCWKLYIPAAGAATVTVTSIILANRIGMRRMAALAAAYAMSEKAMTEYKEKVVEKIGKKKAKEVVDEITQEKLKTVNTQHVHIGQGEVLMLDTYTMKPFSSTMERVRKVENDLRELLLSPSETVNCSDWLKGIGLKATPYSDDFGWNGESGFKLDYTAGLTDDNLPCLVWHFAIEPQYRPKPTDRFQI
jgi:Icc-related predicted phosphoesterase